MAVVAGITACNVIRGLPGHRHVVVTADTGSDDLEMIYLCDGRKGDDRVAALASIRGCKMPQGFARRLDAIMAAHAGLGDVVVIEVGRRECGSSMTVVARIAAQNMARVFPGRRYAVVTTDASSDHLQMIDLRRRSEGDNAMAIFANRG